MFNRDFTTDELEFLTKQSTYKNQGNTTSTNKYVLTHPVMAELNKFVESCIGIYFQDIYAPQNKTSMRITQSWLNYSKTGEWHHRHSHPNSFISGVFYINANKDADKIYFYKNEYKQLDIPTANLNPFNASSWWLPVETKKLLLFPSSLTHSVDPVEASDTRISLAFNTFPVGYLGQEESLTALHLGN